MEENSFTKVGYDYGHMMGYIKGFVTGLIIGSVLTAGIVYYVNDASITRFPLVQPNNRMFNDSNLQTKLEQK